MAETPTWKEAEPPELRAPYLRESVRGGVRVTILILITMFGLVLFSLGRILKWAFGPRVTFHYGVARLWARTCLALFAVRRVVNGQPIRRGGVLASNHASWMDIISLRSVTRINFVSKAEVRKWPVVGYIAEVCETVFIERRRSEAKRQQAELAARVHNDELLCIFPEGTSTDGLRVLPFKSTLMSVVFIEGIHEQAFVQPVTIHYQPDEALGLPRNFYGWWGSMAFESHIWTVATRSRGGKVEITFHEPLKARDFSDRKLLTQTCETAVRSAMPQALQAG